MMLLSLKLLSILFFTTFVPDIHNKMQMLNMEITKQPQFLHFTLLICRHIKKAEWQTLNRKSIHCFIVLPWKLLFSSFFFIIRNLSENMLFSENKGRLDYLCWKHEIPFFVPNHNNSLCPEPFNYSGTDWDNTDKNKNITRTDGYLQMCSMCSLYRLKSFCVHLPFTGADRKLSQCENQYSVLLATSFSL